MSSAISRFIAPNTPARMVTSVAVPPREADGWCIMIRACGRAYRLPGAPAVSRNWPIDAANPTAHVATSDGTSCIVS